MSALLFSGRFADTSATNHTILSPGNYAFTGLMIDIGSVSTSGASGLLDLILAISGGSTLFYVTSSFLGTVAGNFIKPNCGGPYVMTWTDPLIANRGAAILMQSANYINVSQVVYTMSLYGHNLA